jgi:hypothetical protein
MKVLARTVVLAALLCRTGVPQQPGVTIYNQSSSQVNFYCDHVFQRLLWPGECYQMPMAYNLNYNLQFFRHPEGSMGNAYRVQIYVTRNAPLEYVYLYDSNLP